MSRSCTERALAKCEWCSKWCTALLPAEAQPCPTCAAVSLREHLASDDTQRLRRCVLELNALESARLDFYPAAVPDREHREHTLLSSFRAMRFGLAGSVPHVNPPDPAAVAEPADGRTLSEADAAARTDSLREQFATRLRADVSYLRHAYSSLASKQSIRTSGHVPTSTMHVYSSVIKRNASSTTDAGKGPATLEDEIIHLKKQVARLKLEMANVKRTRLLAKYKDSTSPSSAPLESNCRLHRGTPDSMWLP